MAKISITLTIYFCKKIYRKFRNFGDFGLFSRLTDTIRTKFYEGAGGLREILFGRKIVLCNCILCQMDAGHVWIF